LSGAVDETAAWKRTERKRLREIRASLLEAFRAQAGASIIENLQQALPNLAQASIAFYWPLPGEPDLCATATHWSEQGIQLSLPETVPRAPLIFRPWTPDCAMRLGIWDIPVPDTAVEAQPDILLIPCLGFDRAGFRMGYGGGFYDRTLAARRPKPLAVGIAYSQSVLPSIQPEAHDIPMDLIVTEQAAVWHAPKNAPDR
jgi:5-formyltetrahydrofolate cyclo-ligase